MGQGPLHWSANFDEVQDFEGQIRTLPQGTGLMTDAQFATGTRSQPLGDRKAGVSAEDLAALKGGKPLIAALRRKSGNSIVICDLPPEARLVAPSAVRPYASR